MDISLRVHRKKKVKPLVYSVDFGVGKSCSPIDTAIVFFYKGLSDCETKWPKYAVKELRIVYCFNWIQNTEIFNHLFILIHWLTNTVACNVDHFYFLRMQVSVQQSNSVSVDSFFLSQKWIGWCLHWPSLAGEENSN